MFSAAKITLVPFNEMIPVPAASAAFLTRVIATTSPIALIPKALTTTAAAAVRAAAREFGQELAAMREEKIAVEKAKIAREQAHRRWLVFSVLAIGLVAVVAVIKLAKR